MVTDPASARPCAGLRVLLVLTVLVGIALPAGHVGVGQVAGPLARPAEARSSTADGARRRVVADRASTRSRDPTPTRGSTPGPSASGDGRPRPGRHRTSGGSNQGPFDPKLLDTINAAQAADRRARRASPGPTCPPDAVTASGSGLDPDITPAYAALQVARVARARGLPRARCASWSTHAHRRARLGFLGEPRVNVLELNLAAAPSGSALSGHDADAPGARATLRIYLGAAPGRRQDLRHARRGPPPPGPRHRRRRRPRRDPRPAEDRRAARRSRGRAPARASYRGTSFDEMDLDAVLARSPRSRSSTSSRTPTCPGSRHAKRWQDVEELLDAGIDVITTVNVQHLESLNDVVERITGVTAAGDRARRGGARAPTRSSSST